MMDFEVAAHNSIRIVFPEWTVRSCYFHFVKNIKDQAKKKNVPKVVRKTEEYKCWIAQIFGKFWIMFLYFFQFRFCFLAH